MITACVFEAPTLCEAHHFADDAQTDTHTRAVTELGEEAEGEQGCLSPCSL